ncbi:hypothetical protein FALCPG4_009611 [Fusarium falciforme]
MLPEHARQDKLQQLARRRCWPRLITCYLPSSSLTSILVYLPVRVSSTYSGSKYEARLDGSRDEACSPKTDGGDHDAEWSEGREPANRWASRCRNTAPSYLACDLLRPYSA